MLGEEAQDPEQRSEEDSVWWTKRNEARKASRKAVRAFGRGVFALAHKKGFKR